MAANSSADLSPMSKIDSFSATSFTAFSTAGAVSENSVPTRTSTGTGMLVAFDKRCASGIKSASYKDLPTL